MMEADGAELMKENRRRRRTMEGRIGLNDWRMTKLLKEANGIRGAFGVALEDKCASFCFGQKGLPLKRRDGEWRWRDNFCFVRRKIKKLELDWEDNFGKIGGSF